MENSHTPRMHVHLSEMEMEEAIRSFDLTVYHELVREGVDPLARRYKQELTENGDYQLLGVESMLTVAASVGFAEVVADLVQRGAAVKTTDEDMGIRSPLVAWVFAKQAKTPRCNILSTGELLLEAGADPDFTDHPSDDCPERGSARWYALLQKNTKATALFDRFSAQKQFDQMDAATPQSLPSYRGVRL